MALMRFFGSVLFLLGFYFAVTMLTSDEWKDSLLLFLPYAGMLTGINFMIQGQD